MTDFNFDEFYDDLKKDAPPLSNSLPNSSSSSKEAPNLLTSSWSYSQPAPAQEDVARLLASLSIAPHPQFTLWSNPVPSISLAPDQPTPPFLFSPFAPSTTIPPSDAILSNSTTFTPTPPDTPSTETSITLHTIPTSPTSPTTTSPAVIPSSSSPVPSAQSPRTPVPTSPSPAHTKEKTIATFADLGLKKDIISGLNQSGYTNCSSVQSSCLPHALEGKNIFCRAGPGAGKTMIFVIPILERLVDKSEIQAVVLANTPELVCQIYNEFIKAGMYLNHMRLLSYHEHNKPENIQKANILIGTPGRVRTIIKKLDICANPIFALDEADRVRYPEEETNIREVYMNLPKEKQVILTTTANDPSTTATFHKLVPSPSHWLALKDDSLMPPSLINTYQLVSNFADKYKKMIDILKNITFNQMIIFVNHKETVGKVVAHLRNLKYNVIEMSSNLPFDDRMQEIARFKKFETRLMVSTDVLSRGIDIKHANIVLNFDMAQRSDTYLRRVGRAARFGKKGLAISFLDTTDDVVMRKEVEDRFNIKFRTLSLQIEPTTYMNQVDT